MRVGIAQIDSRVGDFRANAARILAAAEIAARDGAELIVFPEMVVTGYPPRDLLLDPDFVSAAADTTAEIARKSAHLPPLVLGSVVRSSLATPEHPGLWDAALVIEGGNVTYSSAKRLLPAYDVFHETRWFVPGTSFDLVEIAGRRIGLLVCEDLWSAGYQLSPGSELERRGAELLICISASPYRRKIQAQRQRHARCRNVPVVYVNASGAQDELVFDGGSFVMASGALVAELPRFDEIVQVVDTEGPSLDSRENEDDLALDFAALVHGVRGFAAKNGLARAFLGLSGGVDSALVACVASEALGPAHVTALAIPSRYTHASSTESARELARALGIELLVHPLEPLHAAAESDLAEVMGEPDSLVRENVQARLRALILMAHVNRHGGLLLNTSNKTELALGYGTLYGDMAGTLAVIGDVTKPDVYALAQTRRLLIPEHVLTRAPSAELRPDQVDPFDYDRVAPIAEALVTGAPLPADADPMQVDRVRHLLRIAEHKRWQAGIVLKLRERAFGTGRLLPVTHAWRGLHRV